MEGAPPSHPPGARSTRTRRHPHAGPSSLSFSVASSIWKDILMLFKRESMYMYFIQKWVHGT